MWVEIENGNRKFLVDVLCKPLRAKADLLNLLALSIDREVSTDLPIFLLGDFNFDVLADGNNKFKQMLQNVLFLIVVKQPKHFSTSKSFMY